MENFGKFVTLVLVFIIGPMINGFVVVKLWAWFVIPVFEANPLRLVEAIGLMFLINYVKAKRDTEAEKDTFWKQLAVSIIFLILMAAFTLLSGFIVKIFM